MVRGLQTGGLEAWTATKCKLWACSQHGQSPPSYTDVVLQSMVGTVLCCTGRTSVFLHLPWWLCIGLLWSAETFFCWTETFLVAVWVRGSRWCLHSLLWSLWLSSLRNSLQSWPLSAGSCHYEIVPDVEIGVSRRALYMGIVRFASMPHAILCLRPWKVDVGSTAFSVEYHTSVQETRCFFNRNMTGLINLSSFFFL